MSRLDRFEVDVGVPAEKLGRTSVTVSAAEKVGAEKRRERFEEGSLKREC